MSEINHRRLGLFFGSLVAFAILFSSVSWLTGVSIRVLLPAYMFTPMLAGFVVVAATDCSVRDLGVRFGKFRWLAGAVLTGLAVVALTFLVALAVPGVGFDSTGLADGVVPTGLEGLAMAFGLTLVIGVTSNAVMAFGEEFGWRGYLLWELAPLGFWKASLVIGVAWGLWHIPGTVAGLHYESFPYLGVLLFTTVTVALSPVYTYLVWRAESVFAAVFFHGIFNGSAGSVLAFTTASDPILSEVVTTPIGLAGIAACGIVAGLIALRGTPSLDRSTITKPPAGGQIQGA